MGRTPPRKTSLTIRRAEQMCCYNALHYNVSLWYNTPIHIFIQNLWLFVFQFVWLLAIPALKLLSSKLEVIYVHVASLEQGKYISSPKGICCLWGQFSFEVKLWQGQWKGDNHLMATFIGNRYRCLKYLTVVFSSCFVVTNASIHHI